MSTLLWILFWLCLVIAVGYGIGAVVAYRQHVKETYESPFFGKATFAQVVEAYRVVYEAGNSIVDNYKTYGSFRLIVRALNSTGIMISMNCEPNYTMLGNWYKKTEDEYTKYQEGKELAAGIEAKFSNSGVIKVRGKAMLLNFGDFIRYHLWLRKMCLLGGNLGTGGVDWEAEMEELKNK